MTSQRELNRIDNELTGKKRRRHTNEGTVNRALDITAMGNEFLKCLKEGKATTEANSKILIVREPGGLGTLEEVANIIKDDVFHDTQATLCSDDSYYFTFNSCKDNEERFLISNFHRKAGVFMVISLFLHFKKKEPVIDDYEEYETDFGGEMTNENDTPDTYESDVYNRQTLQITATSSQATAKAKGKRIRNCICYRTIDTFATKFKRLVEREKEKRKDGRRSIAIENKWLLNAGLFDPQGNYSKYCSACLQKNLKLGFPRLSRLRKLHKGMLSDPNAPQHGLKSRRSNRALSSPTHTAFQIFVQEKSQPNGRTKKYGHNRFFDPQFTRIYPPARNIFDTWTEAQKRGVLQYEFNRLQQLRREEEPDASKKKQYQTVSKGTLAKWLKQYCPRTGIHPHYSDYCSTCSYCDHKIDQIVAAIQKILQGGNANQEEIKLLSDEKIKLTEFLQSHKTIASAEIRHHNNTVALCRQQYQRIKQLEQEELVSDQELKELKSNFKMVLAIDYQQSKLVPYWGMAKQAGETYFLRKLSYTILGIVNHGTYPLKESDTSLVPELTRVYVEEEQNGSKNADHLCSSIQKYIEEVGEEWIKHYVIYLDNAATNKNNTVFQWASTFQKHNKLSSIDIRYMVPGHTKFWPDRLFSRIANTYYHSDVLCWQHLKNIICKYVPTEMIHGHELYCFKDTLTEQFNSIKDLKKYRHFEVTDSGLMIKQRCYEGEPTTVVLEKNGSDIDLKSVPTYQVKNLIKKISVAKMADLEKCYMHISDEESTKFYQDLIDRNNRVDESVSEEVAVETNDHDDDDIEELDNRTVSQIIRGYVEVQFDGDRLNKKRRKDYKKNGSKDDKSKRKDKPVKKKRRIEVSDDEHENLVISEEDSNRNDHQSIHEETVGYGRGKRVKKSTEKMNL